MGVGAVISGDFFGWNFGLATGGFGGMLLAVLVMTAMYLGLCFSIAEMSPALPHAGGAYSFARTAMGPWGGYITGLAENMEYILTPAVIVVGVGGYLGAIFGTPPAWEPLWWLACYGVFVALNIWGVEMTFRVTVVVTLVGAGRAGGVLDRARRRISIWRAGRRPYFPARGTAEGLRRHSSCRSRSGCTSASSRLPLAAEESHDPKRDMPRGILIGLAHADRRVVSHGGAERGHRAGRGQSGHAPTEPLFLGFQTIFGLALSTRCWRWRRAPD